MKFAIDEAVDHEFFEVPLVVKRLSDELDNVTAVDSNGAKMRTHITSTGLVFTTISDNAPSFNEFFPGLEDILKTVDFRTRPYQRSINYEGHFNWKTMVDGYQECLHCQYTHLSFSEFYPPTFYHVVNHHN